VNAEIEAKGVKVVEQYAVLGPYDFVNIVEVSDNETKGRVLLELNSRDTVHILTLLAMPLVRFLGAVA
jgi:uncharacterized protein with GYD domain